jgi:hypothetical protein
MQRFDDASLCGRRLRGRLGWDSLHAILSLTQTLLELLARERRSRPANGRRRGSPSRRNDGVLNQNTMKDLQHTLHLSR